MTVISQKYIPTISEGKLNYFRTFLLIGAIALPTWALMYDFYWGFSRMAYGFICAFVLMMSFRDKFVRKYIHVIVYGMIYASTVTIIYRFYSTQMSDLWSVYHVVMFFALSSIFRHFRQFLFFAAIFSIGTTIAVLIVQEPLVDPMKFLFIYYSAVAVALTLVQSYRWTIRKVERYANYNSHRMRAPVARLQGIMNLKSICEDGVDYDELIKKELNDLDALIRSSQRMLE